LKFKKYPFYIGKISNQLIRNFFSFEVAQDATTLQFDFAPGINQLHKFLNSNQEINLCTTIISSLLK